MCHDKPHFYTRRLRLVNVKRLGAAPKRAYSPAMSELEPQILALLRQAQQSGPEIRARTSTLLGEFRQACGEAVRLHQLDLAGRLLETGEVDYEEVNRLRDDRIEKGRERIRDRLEELLGETRDEG